MTDLEDRVRGYVRLVADEADSDGTKSTTLLSQALEETPSSSWRNHLVPVVAAAAAATVVIGVAAGTWRSTQNDTKDTTGPAVTSSTSATTIETDDLAVRELIDRLRSEGADFEPSALWSDGQLILATQDPGNPQFDGLEGQVVGGLKIVVLAARVSRQDYEHAVAAVGDAEFADRDRVESFNYPTDGSHIIVRIRGFDELDDSRRQALEANLVRVTGVPVQLVDAPRTTPLNSITHK